MRKRSGTRLAAALVGALLAGSVGGLSAAAAPCTGVSSEGDWVTIQGPEFPGGSRTMSTFAVDRHDPGTIYASDGRSVMATYDGGCSWDQVFSVASLPSLDIHVAGPVAAIGAIETGAGGRVLLLVEETTPAALRPHVIASQDRGGSWVARDDGLPALSSGPSALHVSPSGSTDYLWTPVPGGGGRFYSAVRGGAWEERAETPGIFDFGIDDNDQNGLWTWGPTGVMRSRDGARTFFQTAADNTMNLGDVYQPPGSAARFMGYEIETQTVVIMFGDGSTFTRIGGPLQFGVSFASGRSPTDFVFSTREQIYRFNDRSAWTSITPEGFEGSLEEMQIDLAQKQTAWGRTGTEIMGYTALDETVNVDGFSLVPPPLSLRQAELAGPQRTIKLDPGESAEVPYRLTLPGEDTALDVFFLMDTTESMQPSIAGLRDGMQLIADRLASSGIDVRFGLGDYKDYPIAGYGEPLNGDYPYRLVRGIGEADSSFADALAALEASGGGDLPESQLTALDQAVSGSGEPGVVAAGADAGFRPGALPVIVNVTDAGFNDSPAHPSPPSGLVASRLLERGVKQIGLAVYGPDGPWAAEASLKAMAAATLTLAPPGGVDCDGKGGIDVLEGEPLMCRVEDERAEGVLNLAPAILATLDALTKPAPAEIETTSAPVIDRVAPSTTVDLLHETGKTFTVGYRCGRDLAGTRHEVTVTGTVAGREVGEVTTKVVCRSAPAIPEVPLQGALAAVAPAGPVAVIAAAPPAAPPSIPEQAPAPQSNLQAQPGMAHEEQEEFQVATAAADTQTSSEEELLFSAYEPRSAREEAPVALYAAAGLMCAAAGTALSYRLRRAEIRVGTGRPR